MKPWTRTIGYGAAWLAPHSAGREPADAAVPLQLEIGDVDIDLKDLTLVRKHVRTHLLP